MSSVQLLPATATPSISTAKATPFKNLQSCSTMAELKQHHANIIKLGLSSDNDAMGRVIKFCGLSESGDLNYALKVFDSLPHPDAFIYNTMFRGYLEARLYRNCIDLYAHMLEKFVTPNKFSFPPVIRACCVDNAVKEAKQVHAHVIKLGFSQDSFCQNNLIHMYVNFESLEEAKTVFDTLDKKDDVSWTTLISGYSRWGSVDEAFVVFESMPVKNSAAWNAVIAAHVQNNRFREAFNLFERMRNENVAMDNFVAASMLSACTGLGALEQGEWIYDYIRSSAIEVDPKLATTIMDMYCKCGRLDKAFEVFNGLSSKGVSSWNCMIGGFAMHGKGKAAIELLKKMEAETMVTPDYVTFVNAWCLCTFRCFSWACRIHGNIDMAEEIGRQVIELEPNNSGRYVLLANLYAKAGRWEVANIRKLMNDRGVKKVAGFSMIELEGTVSEFIAGGRTHPHATEIYAKLEEMLVRIKDLGYVPDPDGILYDICEEETENPLHYHSEKLAIAFGLLKTKPGETIRITKNLRVCKDCHQASKLISTVYDREIIVRDRNRFHHFKGGVCSCNDYW
ncbi:UNVERIFIED_CONTAM: Pentatricopeptide repeat-containing protein [Sesamum radiatum]|uniref:Pentatricopeptide repeat-containing protein n=1 Tax=Sesamum radiatum TaxID=300843 RepID=A0AAW2LCF8_SESRA